MKKICFFIICLFLSIGIVKAKENEEIVNDGKSAILIEEKSGHIIYEKNSHERFAPASMTKIMSMLIILEEIEKNKLKWDEMVRISSNAASMGGSQVFLKENEKMSVKDLFKAVSIGSANDATVAFAEKIAGSEEEFVKIMNEKVKKLNLKDTNFKNSTGLDVANHYSSAYDMAFMARELVKHTKIFEFSTIYEDYLREDTDNKFWLVNTNKLIKTYEGADGLKTGYTKEAGYCLTATAYKNNMRLIGTIMGASDSKNRNENMEKMLDYGYNLYEMQLEIKKGEKVTSKKINKALDPIVDIVTKEDAKVLKKKQEDNKSLNYEIKLDNIKLPIKKGEKIGILKLKENNNTVSKIDLTVKKDIKKASIFRIYKVSLKNILTGNI